MQMCEYSCRPVAEADDVGKIARYIHLTDPYIYPILCKDPSDPAWVEYVVACLRTKEHIFCREHLQVVLWGAQIVGVACVIPCGKRLTVSAAGNAEGLSQTGLKKVINGYFGPLIEESLGYDGYNITNICIDENHRGKGVGRLLLAHCIAAYGHRPIHLDVIADNAVAVRLYESMGFGVIDTYSGFSGSDRELPCYHMLYLPTQK